MQINDGLAHPDKAMTLPAGSDSDSALCVEGRGREKERTGRDNERAIAGGTLGVSAEIRGWGCAPN